MEITRLTPGHLADYRALMLQAYAEPGAFTSTVAGREALPLEWWGRRVSDEPDMRERVLGAFEGARLVGAAGLKLERRRGTRHEARLFGMHVVPEHRGRGIGRALVQAVLDEARGIPDVRVVRLTVFASNGAAVGLYESCGFRRFGTEPLGIGDGGRFTGLVHMARTVGAGG